MDYKNIYYKIIENAKKETENGNRHVGYFEKHHILPKSLGGSNDENNLVKLTAREHFICHWLLVKMYDKGTTERYKMLCALWRMSNKSSSHKEHYINSRAYEKLRIEFSERVSKELSILQAGEKNSQYGSKWYTNRNTGESKKFKEKPDDIWLEGRDIFNKHKGQLWSIETKRPLTWKNNSYLRTKTEELKENFEKTKLEIQKLWDRYHSGNYKSFREFSKLPDVMAQPGLVALFKKYIPLASKIIKARSCHNGSNPDLVGKYE